jgi:hypothetical protein
MHAKTPKIIIIIIIINNNNNKKQSSDKCLVEDPKLRVRMVPVSIQSTGLSRNKLNNVHIAFGQFIFRVSIWMSRDINTSTAVDYRTMTSAHVIMILLV